ncbi:phosphoribosylformylglycinamidine synthase [Faunimonas pinastri]|uniref:Phosphoribosylformylglycinamidine synthase n=1 Tax=Faunimonas pinastri TaxID=1855383 RepID=A0A1H9N9B0_9HYPH|nr:phosphoribosylformylglycinamidine synthase [Faunimonas pinastri]SER32534.1 phosphoribosylformylglycinamidine synthase [Faunimonas pinastri]
MALYRFYRQTSPEQELCFTIETDSALSVDELARLQWLCTETFEPEKAGTETLIGQEGVEIGPLLTIETPFSSNAVAICKAMGLPQVTRIERSRRSRVAAGEREAYLRAHVDRMTETLWREPVDGFEHEAKPQPVRDVPLMENGIAALDEANRTMGLGMDAWDLDFYFRLFTEDFRRNPTEVELFQLGQSNSEHSRHWYFKGVQEIDGEAQAEPLFEIVQAPLKELRRQDIDNSLVAFRDNGGVIRGHDVRSLQPTAPGEPSAFELAERRREIVCTAETHNHPTFVSPFPGAATGTGGMLRDLSAVGRGSIAGVSAAGYFVGNLFLDGHEIAGEETGRDKPSKYASPRDILVEGSNGVSAYGNEIGIPTLLGFTRSFGQLVDGEWQEPRKPVLYCAGVGEIEAGHVEKQPPESGMIIVGLGGPAYPIGVGGGGASSMAQGENTEDLDFKSVQRGNPEMENRAIRVIRACVELGDLNPVASIHDQGAGGPGNVVPELVEPLGGTIDIRNINVGDRSMSVLEIWSGEYQERFGLLIRRESLGLFQAICERERVPCEILGEVGSDGRMVVEDSADGSRPVDLDLERVLTHMPQKTFRSERKARSLKPVALPADLDLADAIEKVFSLPQVGSKGFLVHKADRCVTGLVARQQCCGPLGLPVSNVAIRASSHFDVSGAAMALGEQPTKMLIDPAAGARMAVGEMLTNMASARVSSINDIRCRANWMWAAKLPGEGARLYDAAVAMRDVMLALGIAIDGGKDSLSMSANVGDELVKSPGELVILGYAPVPDFTTTLTPDLKAPGRSRLGFVDLGFGRNRLGGSSLAQAFGQLGNKTPDVNDPVALKGAFLAVQELIGKGLILALHDRSEGGLVTAAIEMAMAGNCGLDLDLPPGDAVAQLFAEELGLLVEYAPENEPAVRAAFEAHGAPFQSVGASREEAVVTVRQNGRDIFSAATNGLIQQWSATSARLEEEQSDPDCARSEFRELGRHVKPVYELSFTPKPTAPELMARGDKPKVAILREEGTNADREMAAACHAAGMEPWDIAMDDLLQGRADLADFRAIMFCGGFAFMDVFDSGKGWAGTIRFNDRLRSMFDAFYDRPDTLSLGACNGCQLMALLGWIPEKGVPDSRQPRFIRNKSGRFESRWSRVKVQPSPAVHLKGMEGSILGIWSEHGEGLAVFPDAAVKAAASVPLVFVDPEGEATEIYPHNPNGSEEGITALCSGDGRHLALMPHPERTFQPWHWEYMPPEWKAFGVSPWLQLFQNMRAWLDENRA